MIVLVGNAPYDENRHLGQVIDKADVVIRFNHFKTDTHEKWIGSKTTIWAMSGNVFFSARRYRPNCQFEWLWVLPRPKIHRAVEKHLAPLPHEVLPPHLMSDLKEKLGHDPSTGLCAVRHAIDQWGPVSVCGFAGFVPGLPRHYWEKALVPLAGEPTHCGNGEMELLREWNVEWL
jgi:hypothetical protein